MRQEAIDMLFAEPGVDVLEAAQLIISGGASLTGVVKKQTDLYRDLEIIEMISVMPDPKTPRNMTEIKSLIAVKDICAISSMRSTNVQMPTLDAASGLYRGRQ